MSYSAARPVEPLSPVAVQVRVTDWKVAPPAASVPTAAGDWLSLDTGAPARALARLSRPLVSVGFWLFAPIWPMGSTPARIRCLTCAAESPGNADHTSA